MPHPFSSAEATAKRLRLLMQERHLKQADLLRLTAPYCTEYGVRLGRNDLSQYLAGKVAPGRRKLTVLSLALGVPETYLLGYDPPPVHRIPLLGSIACGSPILAIENIEEEILCPAGIDADFCLRAKGDSMIGARIENGDIVFIRSAETAENGEIAAVLIENEATLKRLSFSEDRRTLTLLPENDAYPPLSFTGEALEAIRILGKAVWFLGRVQ